MGIRLGYVCLNTELPPPDRTCRLKSATPERILELGRQNLVRLADVLRWNAEHDITVFRVSSETIPFASHPVNTVSWWDDLKPELDACRQIARAHRMRLSMHPGQFTVLNSPRAEVLDNSVRELEYSVRLLHALGATARSNKIVIHIGGTYGDKEGSLRRFIAAAKRLDTRIRRHLVIENDERHYSLSDALMVSNATKLPVVFDVFHHEWNPSFEAETMNDWLDRVSRTWRPADGRMKIHYSNQWPGRAPGTHSQSVDIDAFCRFIARIGDRDLDIMLEVKDKQRSLLRARECLGGQE